MLHGPDVLPHSHRGFAHSPDHSQRGLVHSPDHSPVIPHRSRALSQSLPQSRCASRHTVNFQLPQPHSRDPTPAAHQDTRYGSLGQLLDVLNPGTPHHSHYRDRDLRSEWMLEPPSSAAGRLSVPSTPSSSRRFYEGCGADIEHGKTSVVRFGYVEKANVNTGSQHSLLCPCETDDPSCEIKDHVHLRKRISDPGWHCGIQPLATNYYPIYQDQGASLKALRKHATHRALEEFESPELKHRFENCCQNNSSQVLPKHYHHSSCSPSQSPILRHKSPVLPSRSPHPEVTRDQAHTRVTAPHTSEQSASPAASPSLSSHRFLQNHRQQWLENEHPKANMRQHLPAGRPTDIQHIISTSNFPTSTQTSNAFQTHGNTYQSEISNSPYNCKHLSHSPHVRNMKCPEYDTSRLSPLSWDSHAPESFNTRRTFYNGNTHWPSSSQHLQNDYPSPKIHHRKSQTLAVYGSPLSSSLKSLSLPGSLNHTDLLHSPEMQLDIISDSRKGQSMQCPQQNFEHHQSADRRDYQQVCEKSLRSSKRYTAGQQNTSMTRTSKCEDNRCCSHKKEPAKKTPSSVEKVSPKSEPSKVANPDTTYQANPGPTGSRVRTQVGWIYPSHMKILFVTVSVSHFG